MKHLIAEEFRIGNFIITPYCEFSQIDEVGLKESNGYVKIKDKPMGYYLSSCKAIPLSGELLLKCGFEKINDKLFIIYIGSLTLRYLSINSGIDWYFEIEEWRIDLHYLHQLQNLYFALTGKELEINL